MRRLVVAVVLGLVAGVTLTACGSTRPQDGPLPTKRIDITFSGGSVTPNGDRIHVAVGQRIELDITADAPGEIHVHSSPGQEIQYDKGSSTIALTPIEAPGVVAVESHALHKVILQLQAQ